MFVYQAPLASDPYTADAIATASNNKHHSSKGGPFWISKAKTHTVVIGQNSFPNAVSTHQAIGALRPESSDNAQGPVITQQGILTLALLGAFYELYSQVAKSLPVEANKLGKYAVEKIVQQRDHDQSLGHSVQKRCSESENDTVEPKINTTNTLSPSTSSKLVSMLRPKWGQMNSCISQRGRQTTD